MEDSDSTARQRSSQALPEGTCLKGLVVESILGTGPFSHTYLTRDVALGKLLVLKEHLPEALCYRDPDSLVVTPREAGEKGVELFTWSVANFRKEARAIAALNHPGIVRVLGGFEHLGATYIAMPFVEGGSLAEQIRLRHADGPEFSAEEIHGLLWLVLEAVNFLHEHGIHHGGIRPENILLNEAGVPSLIGFCGARRRLCERTSREIEKTGYTPIEQTQASAEIGPQSDVFALGATLFAAITGNPPAVARPIPLTRRLRLLERYPQPLLASIDRALEPMPGNRFRDGAEWRSAIWGDLAAEASTRNLPTADEERLREDQERVEQARAERERTENERKTAPATSPTANPGAMVTVSAALTISRAPQGQPDAPDTPVTAPGRSFASRYLVGALALIAIPAIVFGYLTIRRNSPAPPLATLSQPETGVVAPPLVPASPDPLPLPEPAATLTPPAPLDPTPKVEMTGEEAGEVRIFGGIEMVWCPPGTFAMGSPWNEEGRFMDETPHEVILTQGFWIAKTETTQKQWEVITAENPSWRKGENLPVEKVTWSEVQSWLEKKNAQDPPPEGWKWSLPTEAQWEYACRAGTTTPIYSGPLEIVGALNAPALDAIA